jgi:hypothetical protein
VTDPVTHVFLVEVTAGDDAHEVVRDEVTEALGVLAGVTGWAFGVSDLRDPPVDPESYRADGIVVLPVALVRLLATEPPPQPPPTSSRSRRRRTARPTEEVALP